MARREIDPASAVRVLDLWGWLTGVSFDSQVVGQCHSGTQRPITGELSFNRQAQMPRTNVVALGSYTQGSSVA